MSIPQQDYDSVYLHSRRETIVLLIAFAIFLCWSIGVSYRLGYDISPEEVSRTIWGIPRWAFWGVAAPWMVANVFTFWFAWFYMADDPLGEELDDAAENQAEGDH